MLKMNANKKSDSISFSGTMNSQISSGSRRSYDVNFKLMVIREAEATNNCAAGRKFGIPEVNIRKWRQIKEKLRNTNPSRKSFSGPKKGRYELEQKVIETCEKKGMKVCRSHER